MTTKVDTQIMTWVITLHYIDGSTLSEGGFKLYELGKGIVDLTAAGMNQGLGELHGNPLTHIEIR